jgi:AraC-like DNA-binding protein
MAYPFFTGESVMSSRSSNYISSSYVVALLDQAKQLSSVDQTLLESYESMVSRSGRYVDEKLLVQLFDDIGDQIFGTELPFKLGKQLVLETHGFLGYGARSCANIKESILMDVKYLKTQLSFIHFSFGCNQEEGEIVFRFSSFAKQYETFFMECCLSSLIIMLEQLTDEALEGKVYLAYDVPESCDLYNRYIPSKIEFSVTENKIVFPARILDLKINSQDDILKSMAEEQCKQTLNLLPAESSFTEDVRQYLLRNLRGQFSVVGAARKLNVSERTLKRKLRAEGTNYQKILDQLREQKAKELLRNSMLNLGDIAPELGYAEYPAFIKAFKRWTGVSPSEYKLGRGLSKCDDSEVL